MGGAASVEAAHTLDIDYSTLKSSGVDFLEAYKALDSRIKKGKSANAGDVSIPFLAIRQLSKNLRNQESLERTKRKVLKSRSLPNNIKFKDNLDLDLISGAEEPLNDELDHTDLAIIPDPDLGLGAEHKTKGRKPNLFLQVTETFAELDVESNTVVEDSKRAKKDNSSPTANARISPSGAFHVGKIKVLETGIEKIDSFNQFRSFQDVTWRSKRDVGMEAILPMIGGKKDFLEIAALGAGASGVVSEALHIPSLTIVALKMLPIYNQEKRRQVSRELAVLCKNLADMHLLNDTLNLDKEEKHPDGERALNRCENILSLYNAFVDPKSGLINLVIEYMDGGSLEDLVKQGGCKDEQVLADIARQTLNGLSYLHRNKSVHRDIKPANILCSSNGIIKIADFGISKILDHTSGFANSFVGTVCYMSPERITGDHYNFSSDIWSFGLTLLAVAIGHFPIKLQENEAGELKLRDEVDDSQRKVIGGPKGYWAMIQAICDEEPPTAGKEFTVNFNIFIDSCLHKKAEKRMTASELLKTSFIVNNIRSPRHPASIFKPGTNRDFAEEDVEEFHEFGVTDLQNLTSPAITNGESATEDENSIIYAIRMEHLDRLLDRIAAKLKVRLSSDSDVCKDPPLGSTSGDSLDQLFVGAQLSFPERESNGNAVEKTPPFISTQNKAAGSVRSVHFQDSIDARESKTDDKKKPASNLRSRLNIRALELQLPDEEEEDVGHKLPKTSSYFLSTGDHFETVSSVKSNSTETADFADSNGEEVRLMLPGMDDRGMVKWKNLASQLHLPIQIVMIAVRSKLGALIDLKEN